MPLRITLLPQGLSGVKDSAQNMLGSDLTQHTSFFLVV